MMIVMRIVITLVMIMVIMFMLIMVIMFMTRMMIHQHMDVITWMHIFAVSSRLFIAIEVMNAHPFVLHLQVNGCIAGDDSRCIVVLSQLYCGLKLRSDSNEYDTGSDSILKVLLYSDSADGL